MSMLNLVKSDCRRIVKDRPIKIIFIITAILLVLFYLLIYLFSNLMKDVADSGLELAIDIIMSRFVFSIFLELGTTGLLGCLAVAIFLGGDFTFNTIRNKLISGNSRTKVYLSTCISATILISGFYLAVSTLALILSFILFGFGDGGIFLLLVAYFPIYLWAGVFTAFVTMLLRSRSLAIVITIIFITVLPTILSVINMAAAVNGTKAVQYFCEYFPLTISSEIGGQFNVLGALMGIVPSFEISTSLLLRALLVPFGYIALLIPFGAWLFSRASIK